MAASEAALLGLARVRQIYQAVIDARQVPGELTFRNRVNKVNATDADIVAKFLGQAHIADIVADDQKASTYAARRVKFETDLIPNIKLGSTLLQEDIKRLELLRGNGTDAAAAEQYFTTQAEDLLQGIEWREESMLIGMEIDSFTYSRNGMILSISWGMPSDLNITPGTAWTSTTATPISDILSAKLLRQRKYGRPTDRVKMSTPAFLLMIATTEFQTRSQTLFNNLTSPVPASPYQNLPDLQTVAGRMLGMTVELYDQQASTLPTTGATPTYAPLLPLNKVILDAASNDRNNMVKDFANGVVTESIVGNLGPNNVMGKFGASYGPFVYTTVPQDLNPPNATTWAVERGMPRKRDDYATAVLTIGTVTDPISSTITF